MLSVRLVRHIWRVISLGINLRKVAEAHSPDASGLFVLRHSSLISTVNKNAKRRIKQMANQVTQEKSQRGLSLDGWAVAIALLLAALVKLGALKHVGW